MELLGLGPCSVLPDINLPTDADGNAIDLNTKPSTSALREQIEGTESVRTRNNQFSEHLDRILEEIKNLESEEDPNHRRARIEHLNGEVNALEIDVARAQTMGAHRADQLAHLHQPIRARKLRQAKGANGLLDFDEFVVTSANRDTKTQNPMRFRRTFMQPWNNFSKEES
mgnify:FL=1